MQDVISLAQIEQLTMCASAQAAIENNNLKKIGGSKYQNNVENIEFYQIDWSQSVSDSHSRISDVLEPNEVSTIEINQKMEVHSHVLLWQPKFDFL